MTTQNFHPVSHSYEVVQSCITQMKTHPHLYNTIMGRIFNHNVLLDITV